DHRQHLDIAHPETFLMSNPPVGLENRPQRAAADDDANQRVDPARFGKKAEEEPDDDAGNGDQVGQDVMLQIDREENDQRAAEYQSRDEEKRRTVVPQRAGE